MRVALRNITTNKEDKQTAMGQSLEKAYDLAEAIRDGEEGLQQVTDLLSTGVSVNCVIGQSSVLYLALQHDNTQASHLLMDRGADVNKGSITETPLHFAVSRGKVGMASKLLEKGARVNTKDCNGRTPLWIAVSRKHSEMVHLLLQQSDLDLDCPCGDSAVTGESGSTPLSLTVLQKNFTLFQDLLERGADVNLFGENGCCPLHHACSAGKQHFVEQLMQHGCSVNRVDAKGYTPLHNAVERGHLLIVQKLLGAGADVNVACRGSGKNTALHLAARRGEELMVDTLCSADCVQVDVRNARCETPLAVVCRYGTCLDSLKELVVDDLGADPPRGGLFMALSRPIPVTQDDDDHENLYGLVVLGTGRYRPPTRTCTAQTRGVDWTAPVPETATKDSPQNAAQPLSVLVWEVLLKWFRWRRGPHLNILRRLIDAGADLRVTTRCGLTPVTHALRRCLLRTVLLLLCHGATFQKEFFSEYLASGRAIPEDRRCHLVYPVVLALAWSSAEHHRHFQACLLDQPSHQLVLALPQSLREVLQQPLSLKRLCRSVVRDIFTRRTSRSIAPLVEQLSLSPSLGCFLMLSDVLQILGARWV